MSTEQYAKFTLHSNDSSIQNAKLLSPTLHSQNECFVVWHFTFGFYRKQENKTTSTTEKMGTRVYTSKMFKKKTFLIKFLK